MMPTTLNELKTDLKFFLDHYFSGRKFFGIIYGSYAYGTQKETSDIDIIICTEHVQGSDISDCVSYVINLHKRYQMNLDFEIKHENKLVIDYSFLAKAVSGAGFLDENGVFYIPEIVKTPEYLNSKGLLLRFFLDSMVHKHVLVAGNESHYTMFREFAVENLIRIVLISKGIYRISVKELVREFLYNKDVTGDYYLGFEDKPYYHEYLDLLFNKQFLKLLKEDKVTVEEDDPRKYVIKNEWLSGQPSLSLEKYSERICT